MQSRRAYKPNPVIVDLVQRHGASRVGEVLGLNADRLRAYVDGASRRATRWWIEVHAEQVSAELEAPKPVLRLVRSSTTGELARVTGLLQEVVDDPNESLEDRKLARRMLDAYAARESP